MTETPGDDVPPGPETPSEDAAGASEGAAPAGAQGEQAEEVVVSPPLSVQGVIDNREPRLSKGRSIDQTRAGLAWALVIIFGLTIGAAIAVIAFDSANPTGDVTELLRTLVPAETALLGSAVGFYFGTRKDS